MLSEGVPNGFVDLTFSGCNCSTVVNLLAARLDIFSRCLRFISASRIFRACSISSTLNHDIKQNHSRLYSTSELHSCQIRHLASLKFWIPFRQSYSSQFPLFHFLFANQVFHSLILNRVSPRGYCIQITIFNSR